MLARDLEGRHVTVMGLGLFGGGAGVARHLLRAGARVTVTDLRSAEELAPALRSLAGGEPRLVLGRHDPRDFTSADLVVANPAIPPRHPLLAAARAAGVPVTSETALFLAACPADVIAVTGTQGKSSTCHVLGQLLAASGQRAVAGGNLGGSLFDVLDELCAGDRVVLEISSYQLETLPEDLDAGSLPRVIAVAVTNVLADHLERHGDLEAYAAAKRRILELARPSQAPAVLPARDPRFDLWTEHGGPVVRAHGEQASARGLCVDGGWFRLDGEPLARVPDLRLPGRFQRENAGLALGLARLAGAGAQELARALPGATGLPHRLEDLGLRGGCRVVDNGVSTTPDSTVSAMQSLDAGFTLLCGGQPKNLPLRELAAVARERARRVVVFGAAGERFAAALAEAGAEASVAPTLAEGVALAFERMEPGETLLFSPACASFDAFLNFADRARAFRERLPAAGAVLDRAPRRPADAEL